MEQIYIDEILERGREFEDTRYVREMKRIYDQCLSVLPEAPIISTIYAYTIVRLLYPSERWRLLYDGNDLYLEGRDRRIVGDEDPDLFDSSSVCTAKSVITLAEEKLSSLTQQKVIDEGMMTPELEEDFMYGGTHRVYTPLSNFSRVFEDHPNIKERLIYIIEKGDPTMILKLDAGGIKYLLYLDTLLYQFHQELTSIFNRIPPAGCGTGISFRG